jgi:hypothetical protein
MFKTICKLALTTAVTVAVALAAFVVLSNMLVAAPVMTLTALAVIAGAVVLVGCDVAGR